MPSEHARLSPSSAERWTACPPSLLLGEAAPDQETTYAREGTAAHLLAEIKASEHFGLIDDAAADEMRTTWRGLVTDLGLSEDDLLEMEQHTDEWVELLQAKVDEHQGTVVLVEQRLQTGIEGSWGTSDAVLFSSDHVEIVDLKYGRGVRVEAKENPQLRLYAAGAVAAYGDVLGDTERIVVTVFQPRLRHTDSWATTPEVERAWLEWVRGRAALALAGEGDFGPSESACRWCPVAGSCSARAAWALDEDFGQSPDLLSDDEIAELLAKVPAIAAWCSDVQAEALRRAYEDGRHLPGYKVVRKGGVRKIPDPEAALRAFVAHGFTEQQVLAPAEVKLRGLGELEKLVKSADHLGIADQVGAKHPTLEDVLGVLIVKPEGRPALVPESAPGESITALADARRDFEEDPS